MTFAEAVAALDAEGKYGAKRPSMRGYAKALPVEGDGGKTVALVGADGSAATFVYRDGLVRDLGDDWDDWAVNSEMMNALVFADDWFISPADGLELSRTGGGGRM